MGFFSQLVWLDSRMAEAKRLWYGPGQPGFEQFRFARNAARDIRSLGDSGDGLCSATLLARGVVDLLIRAALARSGVSVDSSTPGNECFARWLAQPGASVMPTEFTEEQIALVSALLATDGTLLLSQQPLPKMRLILSTLLDVKDTLLEPLEADAIRVKRVLQQRWVRLALIVVGVAFAAHVVWHKFTDRTNFALNKSVSVSSTDIQVGVDPKGLVDGNRYLLGFHTAFGANQTATIDLGGVQKISSITVYNRTDCCQDRAVPLHIEISEDGKSYRTIALRKDPFPVSFTANFPKTRARYVKLSALQSTAFHLNEVEVY